MPAALTAGEALAIAVAEPGRRLRHTGSLYLSVAGAESNVAVGLARLGVDTAWAGRVGADELGALVVRSLRGDGVDTSYVVTDPDRPTGLLLRDSAMGAPRVFNYRDTSAATRLAPGAIPDAAWSGLRVFHTTGITPALSAGAREFTGWALRRAREAGALVSLDVNYRAKLWTPERAREALAELLPLADLVFVGLDEAETLWGLDTPDKVADTVLAQGPTALAVKLGAEGAVGYAGGESATEPGYRVQVVDLVGAGDAFAAGYLAAGLLGHDLPTRLRWANAMGAHAVTATGDTEGLPDRDELERFVAGTPLAGR